MVHKVQGIILRLTTPFTESGKVYERTLRRLVDLLIEKGVR